MKSNPTTPPRPFDVTAVFPQLAPLARTATRLHPRPGVPSPQDSSIGGPLLWPADEPWPHCDGPHVVDGINPALSPAAVRLERRLLAIQRVRSLTEDEAQALRRIRPPRNGPARLAVAPYEGPIAMLPVAQLYARDVPDLPTPEGADLLQVLWCPFDHPIMPRTALFWREASTVTDMLSTPPEPPAMQFVGYLPEPCLLSPEQVTDYPDHLELSQELQSRLKDWNVWQTAGTHAGRPYTSYVEETLYRTDELGPEDIDDVDRASYLPQYYDNELAGAPGWKVGGWPRWGATDPSPRLCAACGHEMDALLTIATFEDNDDSSWMAYEAADTPVTEAAHHDPGQPTAVQIGSGYDQQLYVCPVSPEHPHLELMH
ncbi:hypothetical protein ACFU3J_08730 [Streptomyces sp. NPDC057411]|uniref:hypothetical protein n=1 Tax=unclassified Streptomyces TaxID=2593676 RepID=UPI003631E622